MRKYAEDYELERTEDDKGRIKKKAKYVGDFYEVNVDAQHLIRFRRIAILLLISIAGLHIAAGFVGNQSMFLFYVALPYVFVFLPLYFFAAGILRLPKEKRAFRRDEVDLSFNRMKKASSFLIALFSLVVVGELIFLIGFAEGGYNPEILFLILEVLAMGAFAFLWRSQKSIAVKIISEE